MASLHLRPTNLPLPSEGGTKSPAPPGDGSRGQLTCAPAPRDPVTGGGVSPVLSTQTFYVTGAGAQARVQRPSKPTNPFLLPAPGRKVSRTEAGPPGGKNGRSPAPGPTPDLPR